MNRKIIQRRIEELQREHSVMAGFPARLRNGSARISSMPEDNDDQEALACRYERIARRRETHIEKLMELLVSTPELNNEDF